MLYAQSTREMCMQYILVWPLWTLPFGAFFSMVLLHISQGWKVLGFQWPCQPNILHPKTLIPICRIVNHNYILGEYFLAGQKHYFNLLRTWHRYGQAMYKWTSGVDEGLQTMAIIIFDWPISCVTILIQDLSIEAKQLSL